MTQRPTVLAQIVVGLILAVVTLEVVARHMSFIRPGVDHRFGILFQPGARFRINTEGHGEGYWNTQGIRRQELLQPGDPKPILVLGDSFTEASQVTDQEVYTTLMEETFRRAGINIPVLNAGVSGCRIPCHVRRAEDFRDTFAPRWTVVQVSRGSFCAGPQGVSSSCYARDAASGKLRVRVQHDAPPSTVSTINWQLRQYFALPGWVRYRFKAFRDDASREPPWFTAGRRRVEPPPDNGPTAPASQSVALVEELDLLAGSYGRRLTLLYLADFDPRKPAEPSSFERELASACRVQHLSCVSLREEFPEFARQGLSPYGFSNTNYNTGHANAGGHRAMARVVARELRRVMADDLQ